MLTIVRERGGYSRSAEVLLRPEDRRCERDGMRS